MITLQVLILIAPMIFELVRESIWFFVRYKADNHRGSTIVRTVLLLIASGVIAEYFPVYTWYLDFLRAFIYGASLFVFFDPLLNASRYYIGKQKHVTFFYYGNSWTDRFMKMLPPYGQIMLRLWIYGIGHAFYWQTNLIFTNL